MDWFKYIKISRRRDRDGGRRLWNENYTTPTSPANVNSDDALFKRALSAANNVRSPNFSSLQEIYNQIYTEAEVKSSCERRLNALSSQRFCMVDGDTDVETDIFERPWFLQLLEHAHYSTYFWYSIIVLERESGRITAAKLIDRRNCLWDGEDWLIGKDRWDTRPIPISNYPSHIVAAALTDHQVRGLLQAVTPVVFRKRRLKRMYDLSVQRFFAPLIHIGTQGRGKELDASLAKQASAIGSSGMLVLPKETEVKTLNTNNTGITSIPTILDGVSEEVTRLLLGQTLTSQQGGARSQAEVHERVLEGITRDDTRRFVTFFNESVLPILKQLDSSIPEGAKLDVKNITSRRELLDDLDLFMKHGIEPEKEWLETISGIKIERIVPVNSPIGGRPPGEESFGA